MSKDKRVNVVLMGYGHVGKAFFQLLDEKKALVKKRYKISPELRAIFKSDGGIVSESSLSLRNFPGGGVPDLSKNRHWKANLDLKSVLSRSEPGVLVECTPSNIQTGEPGLSHIRLALAAGWHVATASKGPLAVDFGGLRTMAQKRGLALKLSGAAAAALPTLDVGLHCLAGAEVLAVEGILNGTTNYILTRMEQGLGFTAALAEAQTLGIAEADPSQDIKGLDTAVKLLLIGNAVMALDLKIEDILVQGIADISPDLLKRARGEGRAVKLLGRLCREKEKIEATVAPALLDRSHPLARVDGANKGITFLTDCMGTVTVAGGKSDPRGAAAALLKDIINVFSSN